MIKKIKIKNFKKFQNFEMEFKDKINIIVGNNETGKSTIIQALYLCLHGMFMGRHIANNLSEYLFNKQCVKDYLESLKTSNRLSLPEILIEVYLDDNVQNNLCAKFRGDNNSEKSDSCGVLLKIAFDEDYQNEYEEYIKDNSNIKGLPMEYYKVSKESFSREYITNRVIPFNALMIDASKETAKNGSDIYISQIVKEHLESKEKVAIAQAHRGMKEAFAGNQAVENINSVIKQDLHNISHKDIKISVDLATQHSWDSSLMTYVDEIPFHYIGKGEQNIIKTALSIKTKNNKKPSVLLVEEPESHLSHSKLNELINIISQENKQIIMTSHNSFTANKLGLKNIILLGDKCKSIKLNDLKESTSNYFKKLPGYDVLRLILSKKLILVEGDSEELLIQKCIEQQKGQTAMSMGIDVMSCRGLTFLRYLEIVEKLGVKTAVITDNDGDIPALEKKYEDYIEVNKKYNIKICYSREILDENNFELNQGDLDAGKKKFNFNTLEPHLLKSVGLDLINQIIEKKFSTKKEILEYMNNNKSDFSLAVFESNTNIKYPDYIQTAIDFIIGNLNE